MAKIFIVDDDCDVVSLFEQFLKIEGHEVVSKAYNGEEAVDIFKHMQKIPEIIIMDHRMPIKNGLLTTKEILNINHNVNVIFVSADYTVKEQALAAGAIDFIEKPIELDVLLSKIEKYSLIKNSVI
jgi:DNA-binding NtrC family response regulator